jgi:hypothetical protein
MSRQFSQPASLSSNTRSSERLERAGITPYGEGMTKKIAISLPDDVAERVAQEDNASAFIADAVRQRMRSEETRRVLRGAGFDLSPATIAETRRKVESIRATVTPELRAKAARLTTAEAIAELFEAQPATLR